MKPPMNADARVWIRRQSASIGVHRRLLYAGRYDASSLHSSRQYILRLPRLWILIDVLKKNFGRRTILNDSTFAEHNDTIHVSDMLQLMGNDDNSFSFHEPVERLHYKVCRTD